MSVASKVARIGFALAGATLATTAFGTLVGGAAAQPVAQPATAATAQKGAAPTQAAAGGDAAKIAKGRELFGTWSCGSCHSLADGGATGHVGPALDGNANLTEEFVVNRVTNGQGAMPAFGGQMTDEEIATVAFYIVHTKAK